MAKRIAIVEDEPMIRRELETMLQAADYVVECIQDFHGVSDQLLCLSPDLVLLDINLPGENGFQICRTLKKKSTIPVLVLTSRDQLQDELQALDLGADEYLTKPFRKERLIARISNVLKRYEGRKNLLEGEQLLLDRHTYTLYFNGQSVVLPGNQGKLLESFLLAETPYLSKKELSQSLWGTTEYIDENALHVNITRLKKRLKDLGIPQHIQYVQGKGYALVKDGQDA
nr:response regulator transcription factor [Olegusella massiliensis]